MSQTQAVSYSVVGGHVYSPIHALPRQSEQGQTEVLTGTGIPAGDGHAVDPEGEPDMTAFAELMVVPIKAVTNAEPSSTEWAALTGAHVHRCAGFILDRHAKLPSGPELGAIVIETVGLVVKYDKRLGNMRSARIRVASAVSTYLQRLRPLDGAEYLGAEIQVADGRIDLGWSHPTAGVFFDEIKSSQQSLIVRDKDTIAQCVKYIRAGLDLYGDNFAGVRLILLAARQASVWVDRHENFHPLGDSPLAVDLLRGEN